MYIVTGGAGFIGSVMVAKLNQMKISDILIVDDLNTSDKWKNLRSKNYSDYIHKDDFIVQVRTGKIRGIPAEEIKGIIHMGACSSTTEQDMDYLMRNNVHYTKDLALFALDNGIRFIYASSAATYGSGLDGYNDDEQSIASLQPLNRYGYSKQLFDLWAYKNNLLNEIVGLKFFNVYGPNEYHKDSMVSVVYQAFNQIKENGKVRLFKSYRPDYSDGEQMRDFIYVKDCAEVMWWLLQSPNVNGIFNLGTGKARSWNDLANSVFKALNQTASIEYIEMPAQLVNQYQYFTEAQMSRLTAESCPVKFHSLEAGAQDYVSNYLNSKDIYL